MGSDQPQLEDVGFQRCAAHRRLHPCGDPDHLVDARPGLCCGEVGGDALAQVAALADVEHLAPAAPVRAGELGDELVDPRGCGKALGQPPLRPALGGDPAGELEQVLDGGRAKVADALQQAVQHVDGGASVRQCPVVGGGCRAEVRGQRRQLHVGHLVAQQHLPRKADGVDHLVVGPGVAVGGARPLEEADVEAGVVRDEDGARRELEETRQHLGQFRRTSDHQVGDAGEDGDQRRDVGARVHKGLELAQYLAAADLHGPELRDGVLTGASGRLEVDDTERDLRQRAAEVLEARLRESCCGHGTDARTRP